MNLIHKIVRQNTIQLYRKLLLFPEIKNVFNQKSIKKVVDIGIGCGVSASVLQSFINLEIEGVDIENNLWSEYRKFKITLYDGKKIPFNKNSFDIALIFFVLHHTPEPEIILKEASRVSGKYILVMEELKMGRVQNALIKIYDKIINFTIFGHLISSPYFRTNLEWKDIFHKLGLKVKKQAIIKSGILVKRVFYLIKLYK